MKMIAMIVWIATLTSLAIWFDMGTKREETQRALTTAHAFFQQVLITRQWNALHGGVYVPITPKTRPNEYLQGPHRDLTTDSGLKLTKINPAYMTRQIAELAEQNGSGIQYHITSLNPLRPENKAADWEARWLKSFEQGAKEQGEFFEEGNSTWFRYMAPLPTESSCLRCHAKQGYKEGEVRGGLSISLPYHPHSHLRLIGGFGSAAILGLIFIFIGGTLYEKKQRLLNAIFNSPVPTCVVDRNYTILMGNESYWAKFGDHRLPNQQQGIKCYDHRPGKFCHTENCPLNKILAGADLYAYETCRETAGVTRHFIVTAKPLLDAKGTVIGCVESFQEITERKRAEEALEESNRKLEAMSNIDGLTEIANRRRFDEVLTKEYARHNRSGAKLSVILLDVDHFKQFNDHYGHVKGDECLKQVAQAIASCATRPADLPARYGGEEFACILPETDSKGARVIAENIRLGIKSLAIPHLESSVAEHVTASIGVTTTLCAPGGAPKDIIAQVDELLYRAKESGRNRVEFADASG